jgi:hypothetical protein
MLETEISENWRFLRVQLFKFFTSNFLCVKVSAPFYSLLSGTKNFTILKTFTKLFIS